MVKVFWDHNNNGPDASDPLAPGAVQNVYHLNGAEYLGIPGAFYTDPAFTYSSYTPNPSRFYVQVEIYWVEWFSEVITINPGYSEHDLTGTWSCWTEGVPCQSDDVHFYSDPWNDPAEACLRLCAYFPTPICFHERTEDERPVVTVVPFYPSCATFSNCYEDCCPASFAYDDAGWTYFPEQATWCNWIYPTTYGCACLVEQYLPVEYGAFEALPRNQAVLVQWSTASEHDVAEFRLFRDGDLIHRVAASNSATGMQYEFLDEDLTNGTPYTYSLVVANLDGSLDHWPTTASASPVSDATVVSEYALHQNYPNPFNAMTSIEYDVASDNHVTLAVRNLLGQTVAELVNSGQAAGRHTVSFDAANLTSGLYFYTVKIGNEFTATKKMLLVK
ncbi:MAG: T9SS type A sorting domain-containing protein [bacterium]|nr:T9SS type A sorting domain-containing protein [bacterium]